MRSAPQNSTDQEVDEERGDRHLHDASPCPLAITTVSAATRERLDHSPWSTGLRIRIDTRGYDITVSASLVERHGHKPLAKNTDDLGASFVIPA